MVGGPVKFINEQYVDHPPLGQVAPPTVRSRLTGSTRPAGQRHARSRTTRHPIGRPPPAPGFMVDTLAVGLTRHRLYDSGSAHTPLTTPRLHNARRRPHRLYDSGSAHTPLTTPRLHNARHRPHRLYDSGSAHTPLTTPRLHTARRRPHRLYDSGMYITPSHAPITQMKQESRAKTCVTCKSDFTLCLAGSLASSKCKAT